MGEVKIKSGNLYPIAIGEDTWNNLNDTTHSNNNGELIVVMGTVENSGIYSPSGSIIRTVHKDLSTYSWSVEIKADSPARLVIGFEGDGVKYFNITSEYQKLTFNNQSFISDRAFVMYNRTGVTRTVYLRNFMLNEGSTALPYQPYFLNHPAHQFTNGQFVDIPTHHYTNGRWQGELTSQSPLEFKATGQSLLDWRIDGASGGVGDWDETEQKYKIPITVNDTTTNLFTDHQLIDGDSIDYATDQTAIPIATGNNILTVDTAVKPKSIFVKFEG